MTVTDELAGRVALVTGSARGIGAATAQRLSALGASVVVNSVSSVETGREVADALPGPGHYVQADIGVRGDCEALVASTVEGFGRLDLLVNNAGWTAVVDHADLDGLTDEILERTLRVNVQGTLWVTRAAMPHLHQSDDGHVVTITSVAGSRPIGSSVIYAMTKAALDHMTLLLAKSQAPVRVNAVAPGLVDTDWTADWDDLRAMVSAAAPAGRSATPDDCAEAVLALVRNRYVTGQVLVVDGGLSAVL
jgi:ketoreductase RED2